MHKLNATGTRTFLQNKFTDHSKLISVFENEFSAVFGIFVLSTLENINNVHIVVLGPLSATPEDLDFAK